MGWSRQDRPERSVSVAALVARFTVAGLLVMALLATVIAIRARDIGTEKAKASAREITTIIAQGIVEPRLTDGVVAGDPEELTGFNDAIRRYVLKDSLVRVKVWNAQGRIVYSDESRLIGQTFALGEDELRAMRTRDTASEVSDLTQNEEASERPFASLLEVYAGVRSISGEPLLFEAYFLYEDVREAGQEQWQSFAPPALAGLLLLQLVQIPFAWSMARRLQRQQQDRHRLLQHAVDASDAARRRIAGDLHDGVVQHLTGLTYTLDAARLQGPNAERDAELVRSTASQLRASTGSLRSLLVDIYPPNLAEEGLPTALTELAEHLQSAGVEVDLDVEQTAQLPLEASSVLFRSAQEVLRNVANHSGATRVQLQATFDGATAALVVDDDGRGFDHAQLRDRMAGGHIGLRSIGDLVADSGGQLDITSAPGRGTRVEVTVPVLTT